LGCSILCETPLHLESQVIPALRLRGHTLAWLRNEAGRYNTLDCASPLYHRDNGCRHGTTIAMDMFGVMIDSRFLHGRRNNRDVV
jgi:hypothetical protein